jgi:hypothetical protein
LTDSPKPLKERMFDKIEDQGVRNCNETVYRIVQNLVDICLYHEINMPLRSDVN